LIVVAADVMTALLDGEPEPDDAEKTGHLCGLELAGYAFSCATADHAAVAAFELGVLASSSRV
jgi:hypothetical protein